MTDINGSVVGLTGDSGAVPIASTGNIITWATATTSPGIKQADKTTNGGTGETITIQAQNETGTTSTGGALNLTSGTGTSSAGAVHLQTGGTTRFTVNASGGITVANLGAGFVLSDGSGNLTSNFTVAPASGGIVFNTVGGCVMQNNGTSRIVCDSYGIGFFNTATTGQPTVSGSRGGNAALSSLLTGLANLGLIIDSSS